MEEVSVLLKFQSFRGFLGNALVKRSDEMIRDGDLCLVRSPHIVAQKTQFDPERSIDRGDGLVVNSMASGLAQRGSLGIRTKNPGA